MKNSEIAIMLTFVNTLDGRIQSDDATILAWAEVLSKTIDAAWAAEYVKSHYAKIDTMLHPSGMNRAWAERTRYQIASKPDKVNLDRHCGRSMCPCNHTACYVGWIDFDGADFTVPCGNCRADLLRVIESIPAPGSRNASDQATIQNRYKGVNV
jgi:hypothetical protein